MKSLKIAVIALMLAGTLSSCWQEEPPTIEEVTPCDPTSLLRQYPNCGGNPPWVYEMIDEWLENEVCGSIVQCDYRDGRGYLIEPYEVSDNFGYSFLNCEGSVLYKGKGNPIDVCPELKIKSKLYLMEKYPSWDSDQYGTSDEFVCYAVNPFTLPRVKELLYNCNHYRCDKRVSICTYRDGVGFLVGEHLNAGNNANYVFLDCSGNLLCNMNQENSFACVSELDIDWLNGKYILLLSISLNTN